MSQHARFPDKIIRLALDHNIVEWQSRGGGDGLNQRGAGSGHQGQVRLEIFGLHPTGAVDQKGMTSAGAKRLALHGNFKRRYSLSLRCLNHVAVEQPPRSQIPRQNPVTRRQRFNRLQPGIRPDLGARHKTLGGTDDGPNALQSRDSGHRERTGDTGCALGWLRPRSLASPGQSRCIVSELLCPDNAKVSGAIRARSPAGANVVPGLPPSPPVGGR